MKKSTKGAFAAGTAAVLLMGGAGSLAYWTADGSVSGATITSGHLTLDDTACNDNTTGWTLEGDAFDPATDTLIPGDTLTKSCNVVVNVKGTHFEHVDIQATTPTGALTAPWDELTVAASVAGSATGADGLAVQQGDNDVPVEITVTWPYGAAADNDLNGDLSSALGDITITAAQKHK